MSEILSEVVHLHSREQHFFTISGALAVSALAGGYAAGRSIQTLVDRGQHQQSIGLDNAESRNCWLGIAGCLLSFASGGAIAAVAKTAQTGASITLAGQVAVKSVTIGSCVVNALGVTSGLADIIMKAVNKEEITPLDIFQFVSVVLFFTNSVISAHQAHILINSIGKNNTGQFSDDKQVVRNQMSESLKQTNVCKGIPVFARRCSTTMPFTATATFFGVCTWLSRKLTEITRSLKKGLISICNYMLKVGKFLHTFCESWKKEMAEVIDKICSAFGVKHWSELFGAQHDDIIELAGSVIAERRHLATCETTVMPSQQSQVIADNSDVGAASCVNNGPNSMVDEKMETSVSYDDEVINILAKFVDRQMCRNPEDLPRYMSFICKFVKNQFQEEKSQYEKMYEMVKNYVDVENFDKKYGISGNPNNHFFNKVFEKFKDEKKDGFTLLKLAFESQDACTSTQEKRGQSSFYVDGVGFYPFYNKLGLASNGLLSEEQYCEMAAELTGQQADRDSIYISACGATAVMQVNAGADVIMVQCLLEDRKVSGIAALLHNPLD